MNVESAKPRSEDALETPTKGKLRHEIIVSAPSQAAERACVAMDNRHPPPREGG